MLMQLHWQNLQKPEQTVFVAQGEFDSPDDLYRWTRELCNRRREEIPVGWLPLICTEDSPYFVFAVTR